MVKKVTFLKRLESPLVFIVLLLVLFSTAGFLVLKTVKPNPRPGSFNHVPAEPTPVEPLILTTAEDATIPEGWKRYVNVEKGYTLLFPENWYVRYRNDDPCFEINKDTQGTAGNFPLFCITSAPWGRMPSAGADDMADTKTYFDYFEIEAPLGLMENGEGVLSGVTKRGFTIADKPAIEYTNEYLPTAETELSFAKHTLIYDQDKGIWRISMIDFNRDAFAEVEDKFNQMLESFEFID